MKIKEILSENYNQELYSAIKRNLLWLKSLGSNKIKTQLFVNKLQSEGFSVNQESLINLLNTEQYKNILDIADSNFIQFNIGDSIPSDEFSDEKVKDMATRAAKKGVNND